MANGTLAVSQLSMLSQSGTGTTTINPPATNTDRTLTLPDASGTMMTTDTPVSAGQIPDGSITTAKIADSNVTTAKIADANITTAKIADSAITAGKIADGAVGTADIADSAVTTAKIADSAITTAKIAAGAVATVDIAANAVTVAKLAREGSSGQVLTSNGAGSDPSYQTISTTPTTAQVLSAYAGASAGGVGTYAFICPSGYTTYSPGSTIAGSNCRYAKSNGYWYGYNGSFIECGGAPSGTWMILGLPSSYSCGYYQSGCVCLRIS